MSEIIEADDDGEVLEESTIDVRVTEGIRPPAAIVDMCESHQGIKQLTTGRYDLSGRVRMEIVSIIGVSQHDVPEGWYISNARARRDGKLVVVLQQTQ